MNDTAKGILCAIGIIAVIWFVFFRETEHTKGLTDYRDEWFTGTDIARVYYCGPAGNDYCFDKAPYVLNVRWDGKDKSWSSEDKWVHYFTIFFNNGGYISGEAKCDKAPAFAVEMDRFCIMEHMDEYGNSYTYGIAPKYGKS